jgi:hypothetical protein
MSLATDIRRKSAELWHIQRVKRLVHDCLAPGPNVLIRVTELPCAEMSCPEPITQITILGLGFTRQVIVVHRRLVDVTAAELANATNVWS